ncbi:DUF732 domain-containing protein [Streptomyces spinosirectus]
MSDTSSRTHVAEEDDPGSQANAQGAPPKRARWWLTGAAVVTLVLSVGVIVTRQDDDGEAKPASAAPAKSVASATGRATAPEDGPPYVSVPTFASTSVRDTAFVADVAQFSTWPSGTEPYGVMSSAPGGSDITEFRAAVIKDAKSVCGALADGTDMEDVPDAVGLPFSDPIDQAGFMVEAVTFYCPDRMAAVTDDVYSKPVPTRQEDDCPTASALEVTASTVAPTGDGVVYTAPYKVKVRNTSSYAVRVQLQQRWFADGYLDDGVWGLFGDAGDDQIVTIDAGDTFAYEGDQNGIYRWNRTEVRVQPREFVFFGCGYRPGPGPGTEDATGE